MLTEYFTSITQKVKCINNDIIFDKMIYTNITEINNNIHNNIDAIYIIPIIEHENILKNINININIILINTEQITRKNVYEQVSLCLNKYKILDYSISNTKYIEKNIFYLPYQINNDEIYNCEKIYDIAMICGIRNKFKRRDFIYDSIRKKMKRNNKFPILHYISLYGKERDDILFKSKILLNIHARDDYFIFEEIRCNRCIFNKIIVISEESEKMDDYYFKDNIIICKYEELINVSIDVINNYEYYYKKLFSNFNLEKANEYFEKKLNDTIKNIFK
jgi:hypothetical protein